MIHTPIEHSIGVIGGIASTHATAARPMQRPLLAPPPALLLDESARTSKAQD